MTAGNAIEGDRSSDWRPIETAPRVPYEPIDLWVVPGEPLRGVDREKPHRIADAHASGNGKHWLEKGRYIEGLRFYNREGELCFDPDDRGPKSTKVTHWLPVPEGPTS